MSTEAMWLTRNCPPHPPTPTHTVAVNPTLYMAAHTHSLKLTRRVINEVKLRALSVCVVGMEGVFCGVGAPAMRANGRTTKGMARAPSQSPAQGASTQASGIRACARARARG